MTREEDTAALREKLKTALADMKKQVGEAVGPYEAEKAAERMRKELAMSGEALVTFKLRFAAWQEAFLAMGEAMERMTDEQREKCEAAIRAQAGRWSA